MPSCNWSTHTTANNLFCSGLTACWLLVAAAAAASAAAPQPSILFVLADDLGYGDISTYPNPSSRRLQTPHVAQLAKDGMMFTDAYAGYSVCAPSRREN